MKTKLVFTFVCLLVCAGCPANSGTTPAPKPGKPTLHSLIAERLTAERAERATLAKSIADQIRAGTIKTPEEQGKAWNAGDATISKKTSGEVSGLLKRAFNVAPHDKVWDELSRGYGVGTH